MNDAFITTKIELLRLGQNIMIARKRRKLTTTELALKANISRQALMRIEQGNLSVGISKVFNVLSALSMLKGISDFIDPELDREPTIKEFKRLREGKPVKPRKHPITTIFNKQDMDF